MNDWNIYVILLNCAYTIYLAAFMAKNIVWLRLLTVAGNYPSCTLLPVFFYDPPLWNSICLGLYLYCNQLGNAFYYLPRKQARFKLSDLEQKIYDLTFKSLEPRVFKKLDRSWIYRGATNLRSNLVTQ